jgi:hypothetical protein
VTLCKNIVCDNEDNEDDAVVAMLTEVYINTCESFFLLIFVLYFLLNLVSFSTLSILLLPFKVQGCSNNIFTLSLKQLCLRKGETICTIKNNVSGARI